MADKIHCIRKTLRLMPQEAEMLAKKAGESGMCEADYLRLLISQKPNDYPEVRELLKELINEVIVSLDRHLRFCRKKPLSIMKK